jgi:hypothetical protein
MLPIRSARTAAVEHEEQISFLTRHPPIALAVFHIGGLRMQTKNPRCAGIDVHKDSLKVAARVDGNETVETFGTSSSEIFRMADWLASLRFWSLSRRAAISGT